MHRRQFLQVLGSAASLACVPTFSAHADQKDETQASWILDALANKHDGHQNIPPSIIVDKVNAKAHVYAAGQEVLSIDLLLGRSRKDVVTQNQGVSIFDQEVTPAGTFEDIRIVYDPSVSDKYYRKMLVSFMDVQEIDGVQELLAFHSVLGIQNDLANVNDGNPANNNLSNGCIRMSKEDLDAFLEFCLQDKTAFLDNAPERGRYSFVRSGVTVIIAPEEDVTRDNTLKATGLSEFKTAYDPSLPEASPA